MTKKSVTENCLHSCEHSDCVSDCEVAGEVVTSAYPSGNSFVHNHIEGAEVVSQMDCADVLLGEHADCNHYLDCNECVIHFPECRECIISCNLIGGAHEAHTDPEAKPKVARSQPVGQNVTSNFVNADEVEFCSSWPLKQKRQKCSVPAKSRKGTKLQTKSKFQQKMLEESYHSFSDMNPSKMTELAAKLGLSYSAVYKWLWDRNQIVDRQRSAQKKGLHRAGRVFLSKEIFKVTRVAR